MGICGAVALAVADVLSLLRFPATAVSLRLCLPPIFSPQGYVFSELSKLTHGDPAICDKIADWCASRLTKPEPSIKWKVRGAASRRRGQQQLAECACMHASSVRGRGRHRPCTCAHPF